MLDFDQMVVDVHDLYRVVFLNSPTPEAFLQAWKKRSNKELKGWVKEHYAAEPKRVTRILKAYRYSRARIHHALRKNIKNYKKSGVPSYLSDQAEYDFIVQMFREDRIVAMRGDLTKTKTMQQLGAVLKKHNLVVRVYHPSNAEQYFKFGSAYKANIKSLPIDDRSIVARTRAWAKFVKLSPKEIAALKAKKESGKIKAGAPELGTPPKRKEIYYTYATQPYNDFLTWLNKGEITNVRQMLPYSSRVEDKYYAIHPYDPSKLKKKK